MTASRPRLGRAALAALLATALLGTALLTAARPAGAAGGDTAYVDVAAATLWAEPDTARPIDAPATGNPVDLRTWTDSQTLEQRQWLVGKLETQAVYGTKVTILDTDGDWDYVAVAGQPTPLNALGYPGWVPAVQITAAPDFATLVARHPLALVTAATTTLYADAARTEPDLDLSLDTRLPVLGRSGGSVRVATPDRGDAWLPAADVRVYRSPAAIPPPTGADLVRTATLFVGLPYVWAGTSAWGFDCSGLTHTIYDTYGITIPRDADAQYAAGTPVDFDAMRPGDLIFYAYSDGYVHHVGMYIGDGYEIDAPNNTDTEISTVEVVKVADQRYADQYVGSRRFL